MRQERVKPKVPLPAFSLWSDEEEPPPPSTLVSGGPDPDLPLPWESHASLLWRSHPSLVGAPSLFSRGGGIGSGIGGGTTGGIGGGGAHTTPSDLASLSLSGVVLGAAPSLPPLSSFCDPYRWLVAFRRLRREGLPAGARVVLSHRRRATWRTPTAVRAACEVRVLPSLDTIKAALRRPAADRRREWYEMWESASADGGDGEREGKGRGRRGADGGGASHANAGTAARRRGTTDEADDVTYLPTPHIWLALSHPERHEISVHDALSGARLLCIAEPKGQLAVTSLLHAPFRGFMDRQLRVISIHKPKDLLRLKTQQLIETDYVWVGFTDGSVRLFPANPNRIRSTDRSEQIAKGELEDVVFELPKYHNASIIAISRSPCHGDDEGMDLSTMNRLSAAIHYMTAASSKGSENSREHYSLMCTASVDSSIVVWDVRKIYQTLEAMRVQKRGGGPQGRNPRGPGGREYKDTRSSALDSAFYSDSTSGDIVTIDGYASGTSGQKKIFCVRSTCTMVKVRPVLKLKGGVAALKSVQWVSTLVTTEGYRVHRRVADATRNAEEQSAPKFVKVRRETQTLTRFQRREEHRRVLGIDESEMQEVEEELKSLMPALSEEPTQSLRINLIIAGDAVGSIHLWNLDEELRFKQMQDPFDCGVGLERHDISPQRAGSLVGTIPDGESVGIRKGSESPGRTSLGSHQMCYSTASPSIQMSALGSASRAPRRAKPPVKALKPTTKRATSTATVPLLSGPSRGLVPSTAKKRTAPAEQGKEGKPSLLTRPAIGPADAVVSARRTKRVTPSATPSRPKPSGRLVKEEEGGGLAKHGVDPSASTSTTTELLRGRLSKLQKLATMQQDGQVPLKAINAIMTSDEAALAASNNPASEEALNRQTKRRVSAASKVSTSARPTETARGKASVSQARVAKERKGTATVSLSRRKEGEPQGTVRNSLSNTTPQEKPQRRAESPQGKDTTSSRAVTRNDILSRASKCRIEFTGGVAINGMAVDIPNTLRTTLRQWPNPEERPFSILEEPSPEEMERRRLENSFEELTEHKALFFVFQKLQLYVAVEGVVLNLECTPLWKEDSEGYDYFKRLKDLDREDAMASLLTATRKEEMPVVGQAEFPCFTVQLRKRTLEAHSQPVIRLFFDKARGLIWVARNDGLLSLFSKDTKQIVTRVAHPCADTALGPPPHAEWKKQQEAYLRESNLGHSRPHLEWHEETQGYEPAHFNIFLPFCKRSQTTLILLSARKQVQTEAFTDGHLHSLWYEAEKYANSFGLAKPHDLRNNSGHFSLGFTSMQAQKLDGRSDMDAHACRREKCLGDLFDQFLHCRDRANQIRRAQKDNYQFQCNFVSNRVRYIMQELSACTSFLTLSHYYDIWKKHARHYRREHILRRQRASRVQQLTPLADVTMRNTTIAHQGQCFYIWFSWYARRAMKHKEHTLKRIFVHLMTPARRLPTGDMMRWLWEKHTQAQIYRFWKSIAGTSGPRCRRGHSVSTASARSISPVTTPITFTKRTSQDCGNLLNVSPLVRTATCTYLAGPEPPAAGRISNAPKQCTPANKPHCNGDDVLNRPSKLTLATSYTYSTAYIDPCSFGKENIAPNRTLFEPNYEDQSLISTFLEMMALLFDARHAMMQFKETNASSQSILDESWLSIVESSEGGAEVDDEAGRRLAVFSYGLLPLLQGLLSTASDVLSNLNNPSVADEVVSLMGGIQLCMDYVTADSGDYLASLSVQENAVQRSVSTALFTADNLNAASCVNHNNKHRECTNGEALNASKNGFLQDIENPPSKNNSMQSGRRTSRVGGILEKSTNPYLMSPSSVFVNIMKFFAHQAMNDQESLNALKEVTREKESLEAFIAFLEDENAVERRCPLFT